MRIATVIQGVLLTSIIGYNYIQIFKCKAENALHSIGIVVILLSYNAAFLTSDQHAQTVTDMVIVMSLLYVLLVAIICAAYLYKTYRSK